MGKVFLFGAFIAVLPLLAQQETKASFEVASIKPGNPNLDNTKTPAANFGLNVFDSFAGPNPHGRLTAQFPLETYIYFAYKLPNYSRRQRTAMLAHIPKWVSTDQYAINAKAEGDPTKDQMRLMMQSLLADRFKLAAHFERQEAPVLALVLDKPGKIGSKFYPHSNGPPCDVSGVFPPVCNTMSAIFKPNNVILIGGRDLTLAEIAAGLTGPLRLELPLVDQTVLDGHFDFSLEFTLEPTNPAPDDLPATTYQEAFQDQLGLKLKSTKVLMDTLVIDHVERPSEN